MFRMKISNREKFFPQVSDEQWNDWKWQTRNRIETLEDLTKTDFRKDFALRAKQYRHSNILFNMLDGTNPKQTIWKILYPDYSKPFKKDE